MEIHQGDRFGGRKAVVIGGSLAGLISARVLADHFDDVVVIERDGIPDDFVGPRKGAPQGRQTHALLAKGGKILSDLFPGLVSSMLEGGAVEIDFALDVAWHQAGGWRRRVDAGLRNLCSSRPFLESHVRRRVFALPGVRRLDACDATGLRLSADRARVTGVTVKRRSDGAVEETIDADLVVDAGGRGSRLPAWLEASGYGRPEETELKVHVSYSSRFYRRPEPSPHSWKGLFIVGSAPKSRRLGLLLPVEGDRWLATIVGTMNEHPPDDHEGWLEFARGLPADDIYRALREAEPLSEPMAYKFPANFRVHYERMVRFPDGLAVVGDAFASLNPVYGQGMTIACLDALELDKSLKEQRRLVGQGDVTGLSRRCLAAVTNAKEGPWTMATSEDFRDPAVLGKRPVLFPVMRWYFDQVHLATMKDDEVMRVFIRATNMVDGAENLLSPRTILRVLRAARR
jgi:2-polyprenyl-6-methoxyphenol hydroxylase-like FAD-dependent oxidoreductase